MRRVAALIALTLLCACGAKSGPVILQGYAEADYLYLAPREPGFVDALAVKEGDQVAAGALVFRLDTARASATLAHAQAARAASGESAAAAALAIREANADLVLARKTLARSEALFRSGFVAKAQVDQGRAAVDAAAARVRTAAAQAESAASQTGAARADVALAREQADDRTMTAPAAGRIEIVFRRSGEFVNAGEPVAALLPPANMKIRFFAPEPLLSRLRPGGAVHVTCDGCAKDLTARISFVATQPQFTPPVIYSREERRKLVFLVEARPAHPEQFRPGQPVEVRAP